MYVSTIITRFPPKEQCAFLSAGAFSFDKAESINN